MRTRLGLAALAAAALLGGCQPTAPSGPAVERAWVRLPALPGRPAAAYFTLRGGHDATRLIAITSPRASRIELHESMKAATPAEGGMTGMSGMGAAMTMRALDGVDLPAGGSVRFAPGGYHAMIFGLDPALKAGDRVPLSFRFSTGGAVEAKARAVAAGDPDPS